MHVSMSLFKISLYMLRKGLERKQDFIHTDCKRNDINDTNTRFFIVYPHLFNYSSILQIQGVRTEKLVY